MTKRFDIARQMVNGRGSLFIDLGRGRTDVEEDQLRTHGARPRTSHPDRYGAVRDMVTPLLSAHTQDTLKKAATLR